jgi:hypothetical protein
MMEEDGIQKIEWRTDDIERGWRGQGSVFEE